MPKGKVEKWERLKRRRCKNCPSTFKPKRPEQVFCSDRCRYQFHHSGGAYQQLKSYVERLVKKEVKAQVEAELKKPQTVSNPTQRY